MRAQRQVPLVPRGDEVELEERQSAEMRRKRPGDRPYDMGRATGVLKQCSSIWRPADGGSFLLESVDCH